MGTTAEKDIKNKAICENKVGDMLTGWIAVRIRAEGLLDKLSDSEEETTGVPGGVVEQKMKRGRKLEIRRPIEGEFFWDLYKEFYER